MCAPLLRALDGVPCDGGCPGSFSQCVCDARGQLREAISDTSRARVVVRQEALDRGETLVETQLFLGSHATATHAAVRSDSSGRDLERVETTGSGTFITRSV